MVERRDHETGAALLTVLLLVAVMAVVAAVALQRLNVATRLAANGTARDQAMADAGSAAFLVLNRANHIIESGAGLAPWVGRTIMAPMDGADIKMTLSDGGTCFNLNSVVNADREERSVARPDGVFQFRLLMQQLGIDSEAARGISVATADWIDSNSEPLPDGAEDEVYLAAAVPYRTANRYMRDISELRAVRGMTPEIYTVLRPWICALPSPELSPININALKLDEAPLLAMLFDGKLPVATAREFLARRPSAGWSSSADMLSQLARAGVVVSDVPDKQLAVTPRWIVADIRVRRGGSEIRRRIWVDCRDGRARLAMTRNVADDER